MDILLTGPPVGHLFFVLSLGLKDRKWDCSPGSTPEGQSSKRAHAGTEKGNVSSGYSTLPIQLEASHSPKQPELELINLPYSPVKAAADPNNWLAVEASGSTVDPDRDSVVEARGMTLTRVVMCQIQAVTHRKVLLTLVPSQQLGTTSCVWIPRRQPSIPLARSSGRKYGPLAALLRVSSGQRPI